MPPPPQITSVYVHLCIRILRPWQNHYQTKPIRKTRTASGKHRSQRESRASTELSGAAAACAGPQPCPPGTVYNQLEPADLKITGGGRSPWLSWSPTRSQKTSVEVHLLRVTTKAVGCLVRVGPSSAVAWAMDSLTEVTLHGDRRQMEDKEDQSALSPKTQYKEKAWCGHHVLSNGKCALFLFLLLWFPRNSESKVKLPVPQERQYPQESITTVGPHIQIASPIINSNSRSLYPDNNPNS